MGRPERLILIVDDSPKDRECVRRYLNKDTRFDYRFLEEQTGLGGLKTVQTPGVDCLLLDYDLPDLDGLQFLAELAGRADRSPLAVVMLTGRGGEVVAVEALKRGVQDYLIKGHFSPEVLRKTVEDAIERVATRRELDRQRQELERLYDEARESDRLKDEFLAMLAHELRNPLAPILNAVHVMKLGDRDPAAHRHLCDVVEQQVRHLCRLVDDLLDVSRITRGKIQLRSERVDLASIVRRAVENIRPAIDQRRQGLVLELPDGPVPLEADATRIEQVLANLLGNASKYTDPGGSIALRVDRDGDDVRISVRDDGIGIEAGMLPKVFELFAQADHSLGRAQGGLGLGLTLVRNLVQLHGGSVEGRSEGLGRGSEFVVRLPSAGDAEPPEPTPGRDDQAKRTGSLRVLIVDDNVHAAESLAMVVQLWGHDSEVVHDGAGAIAAVESYKPQAVLLDIGLPGMDGYGVLERIRALPDQGELTIIAMTGYGRDEDFRRSISSGFDQHLVKPIDFDALQAVLDAASNRG